MAQTGRPAVAGPSFVRGIMTGSNLIVPIVQRPRTWPFQGQNSGSNPDGDASLRSPEFVSELRLGRPAFAPAIDERASAGQASEHIRAQATPPRRGELQSLFRFLLRAPTLQLNKENTNDDRND